MDVEYTEVYWRGNIMDGEGGNGWGRYTEMESRGRKIEGEGGNG